ncbi:MAG: ComEC/Rec2 family competence protein [Pseudomonadota bacterium]
MVFRQHLETPGDDAAADWRDWRRTGERLVRGGFQRVKSWAAADAHRLVLWTPVAIGAGAGFYFWLKTEPDAWLGPACACLALIAVALTPRYRPILMAVLLFTIGFCAADFRTSRVASPVLERELGPRFITGELVAVGEAAKSRRLIIKTQSIDRLAPEKTPERIRISWRGKEFAAAPGDVVRLRAGLSPPPPPVAPGAFDFARHLYFQRIGAVGYAVSAPRVLEPAPKSMGQRIRTQIEQMRLTLSRRITRAAPGEGGAIVAAVVTGKRDAIAPSSEDALRDSGLAHLLAISGLHMGLATGLIFFVVRGALALIPALALQYPIKKWAAAAALTSGFFYLLLSGGGWSARRAFIMTAVIFIAMIADRRALSLRNVAIAACIILLTTPEALMHPGFQMSFAAVTALIAAYEWASGRQNPHRSFSTVAKFKRYGVGIAVTDTIAAVATAPFALYHFNRVAIYSLPANLAAMPLMAFWIMPFAVLGLALAPLGLDAWAWRASAGGVEFVLAAASYVSSRPGAISLTPQWPLLALLTLTVGALWLCLQSARWRYAGLASIPVAAVLVWMTPSPEIFIARSGENVAFAVKTDGEQALAVFDKRKNRFDVRAWKEYLGLSEKRAVHAMRDIGRCDEAGCVIKLADGAMAAVSSRPEAFFDDCARADIVIALYPLPRRFREADACDATFVDRRHVWESGAHTVYSAGGERRYVRNVLSGRGARPWTGMK